MDQAEKIRIAGVQPMTAAAPFGALPLITADLTDDDPRYWMKLTDTVTSRPLMIDPHRGGWVECFKIAGPGLVNRHRHTTPALVYCLDGTLGYLEHDWILGAGSFLYEPAGESHSFCCFSDGGARALAVMFGPLTIVDETGKDLMTIDGFEVLQLYRDHCENVGLGKQFAEALVR